MSPSRRLFYLLNAIAESVAEAPDEELADEMLGDPERVQRVLLEAAGSAKTTAVSPKTEACTNRQVEPGDHLNVNEFERLLR